MEATTELQHVGGYWKLHQGERSYLSPAAFAETFPSGYFGARWNSAYYGSAALQWSKISQKLHVEVVLGIYPYLMNSAHWQNLLEGCMNTKNYRLVQIIRFFILHSIV
jgi:hypothetical protein